MFEALAVPLEMKWMLQSQSILLTVSDPELLPKADEWRNYRSSGQGDASLEPGFPANIATRKPNQPAINYDKL